MYIYLLKTFRKTFPSTADGTTILKDGVLCKLTFQSLAVSLRTTRFNIQKFCMVLALRRVFCADLVKESGLCCTHHKLIGLYNRGGKCLQRGTD